VKFSKELLANPALLSGALGFNPVLARSTEEGLAPAMDEAHLIPQGAVVQEDGSVALALYAPKAASVTARLGTPDNEVVLNRTANGVWTGRSRPGPRSFLLVEFYVDGNLVLNPLAPIGYGYSKPINIVDIPEEDCDFYLCKDVGHGSVSREYFHSSVTGTCESALVYLPPDYHRDPDRRYPVLYLQHGHGENENCWVTQGKVNFILDNLIAAGEARPMIVVMLNGMVQKDGAVSLETMSAGFASFLLADALPFIQGKFRALDDREGRAMAGLSMGSIQTSLVTLRRPDLFAWMGIFSGFMSIPAVLGEVDNSHLAALDDAAGFNQNCRLLFRSIGETDELMPFFAADTELCKAKNINNQVKFYKGRHEWKVWRESVRDFLRIIF
jgi:enterochelin esterase-like enzyme